MDKFTTGDHTVGEVKNISVDETRLDEVGLLPIELLYWRDARDLKDTWTLNSRGRP